jgi:hypothetical protein
LFMLVYEIMRAAANQKAVPVKGAWRPPFLRFLMMERCWRILVFLFAGEIS